MKLRVEHSSTFIGMKSEKKQANENEIMGFGFEDYGS